MTTLAKAQALIDAVNKDKDGTMDSFIGLISAARNDGPEIAQALVTAMAYLREGHEKLHGHMGDHDNCEVRDFIRRFYGEGR